MKTDDRRVPRLGPDMDVQRQTQMQFQNPVSNGGKRGWTATIYGSAINFWTLAFVVLKLCGVIGWSWWWVLSPLWIPVVIILILVVVSALFGTMIDKMF